MPEHTSLSQQCLVPKAFMLRPRLCDFVDGALDWLPQATRSEVQKKASSLGIKSKKVGTRELRQAIADTLLAEPCVSSTAASSSKPSRRPQPRRFIRKSICKRIRCSSARTLGTMLLMAAHQRHWNNLCDEEDELAKPQDSEEEAHLLWCRDWLAQGDEDYNPESDVDSSDSSSVSSSGDLSANASEEHAAGQDKHVKADAATACEGEWGEGAAEEEVPKEHSEAEEPEDID